VLFAQDGYKKAFETPSLTYLFITMGGDDHRKSILKAAAQQLREMSRRNLPRYSGSQPYRLTTWPFLPRDAGGSPEITIRIV